MADENAQTGKIDWVLYDPDDEGTPCLQEVVIVGLKNCKAVFIPRAYFGLADDRFYEVKYNSRGRVCKRIEHKFADFDEIAWAVLNVPSWWHKKEKEDAGK